MMEQHIMENNIRGGGIEDLLSKYPQILRIASSGEKERWKDMEEKIANLPIAYQLEHIKYQTEYFSERSEKFIELPLIITTGSCDIGIWPLCIIKKQGAWTLGSLGGEIVEPLFLEGYICTAKTQRKYYKMIFSFLADLSKIYGLTDLKFQELVLNGAVNIWHRMLMEMGASIDCVTHDSIFDLQLSDEKASKMLHKTTAQRIEQACKYYDYEIIDKNCPEKQIDERIEQFRQHHIHISGRETRGQKTWRWQAEGVKRNRDFLVFQYDKHAHTLDGATLFTVTHSHCYYSVSAYNRDKFDKAIGHQAQAVAIKKLRELGVRWYIVGDRYYPNDGVDEKNIHISEFKEAFGTGLFLKLHISLKTNDLLSSLS